MPASQPDVVVLPREHLLDAMPESFGHPRGLWVIVFTEAWERFSFYGMQALLVLYMAGHLFLPENVGNVAGFGGFRSFIEGLFGTLSTQAFASQVFGLYVGFVYFTPVLGGWLGDRFLGRTRAVMIGALSMAAGHFLMAFETSFLIALLLLIIGSGFLKGNLAAQVGQLYATADGRRDTGYSLYVMAINVGAFIAPLVCGTLGELVGWHYGFGAAGIGMLVGLTIYIAGRTHLPPDTHKTSGTERARMMPGDGMATFAVITMLAITALYWIAQTQVWNMYPLWLKGNVERTLGGFEVPVTWFQSLDSLTVLLLGPPLLVLWGRQRARGMELADINKIALGSFVFGAACLLLTVGEYLRGDGPVSIIWPVVFHFACAIGYLYLGPIALALTSRAAPPAVNAMMVGCYYLALFAGSNISGWLGRFYETMPSGQFWAMHGAIAAAGAVLILVLKSWMVRAMRLEVRD
jgi:POT family proton-dependent oligopeptide transporter